MSHRITNNTTINADIGDSAMGQLWHLKHVTGLPYRMIIIKAIALLHKEIDENGYTVYPAKKDRPQ